MVGEGELADASLLLVGSPRRGDRGRLGRAVPTSELGIIVKT